MSTENRRRIALEGTKNCRDLGAIPLYRGNTKLGAIYRSDALNQLTANDHVTLEALSLGAIIDLRIELETTKAPNRLSTSLRERELNLSFLPNNTLELFERVNRGELDAESTYRLMLEQYRILALEHTANYRSIIREIIAHPDQPVLFHCTSGKDRTGLVSAILLATVGASEEAIIADYEMTNGHIRPISHLNDNIDQGVVSRIMAADPNYMRAAFDAMKNAFGSIESYLSQAVGIDDIVREKLHLKLVE